MMRLLKSLGAALALLLPMKGYAAFQYGTSGSGGGGGVSGSGTAGQSTFWSGSTSVSGSANYLWDNVRSTLTVVGTINIGSVTPDPSAIFDMDSITQGSRPAPQMTTTQRNGITSPASGLEVYNTTLNTYDYWNGTSWLNLVSGAGTATRVPFWSAANTLSSDSNFNWDSTNHRLGILTAAPTNSFSVGASNQFGVNSTGNLVLVNNVSYGWPASQGGASTVLTNDGAGNLSWVSVPGLSTGTINVYEVVESTQVTSATSYTFATVIVPGQNYRITTQGTQNTSAANLFIAGNDVTSGDYIFATRFNSSAATAVDEGSNVSAFSNCLVTLGSSGGNQIGAGAVFQTESDFSSVNGNNDQWLATTKGTYGNNGGASAAGRFLAGCWDNSSTAWNTLKFGTTAGTFTGNLQLWEQVTSTGALAGGGGGGRGPTPYFILDSSASVTGASSITVTLAPSTYSHWKGTFWGQPSTASDITSLLLTVNGDSTAGDYFSQINDLHSNTNSTTFANGTSAGILMMHSSAPISGNGSNTYILYNIDVSYANNQAFVIIYGGYRADDGVSNTAAVVTASGMHTTSGNPTSLTITSNVNMTTNFSMAGASQ